MMNMIRMLDQKLHMRRFQTNLRRGMAGALAAVMILPMTTTFAAPVGGMAPIKKAGTEDFPDIEIEGNVVRDEFGFTTGFFELGLRVKTPTDGVFRQLNVSLQYDDRFLTPVDWSPVGNDITNVSYTGSQYYKTQLPAQKLPEISTATALTGTPSTSVTAGDSTMDHKVFMTFVVNSYEDKEFPGTAAAGDDDLTTLAVVRFRIKEDYMDHISITKNGADDYSVLYNNQPVENADQLLSAIGSTTSVTAVKPVEFTPDKYIKKSVSNVPMALEYKAGFEKVVTGAVTEVYDNRYYHIPDYDPDNPNTYDVPTTASTIGDKTYTFDRIPKTENEMLLAWDPDLASGDTATAWAANRLSYVSNLIVNTTGNTGHTYIKFPIVSKRSFVDQRDLLGNMTTIVYVDWDNTLLGTQIVPKNADVRGLVSDYVAENFIYHDDDDTGYGANDLNNPTESGTRDGVSTDDVVSSLERIYNYRGKYIATGPAADGTPHATVVDDNSALPKGSEYPLTNKLDYVFFKRPMEHTNEFDTTAHPKPSLSDTVPGATTGTTQPKYTGATDPAYIADLKTYNDTYNAWFYDDTEWSQKTVNDDGATPYWDVEHPYAYGWAQCTVDNYQDVWTTLGMGELGSTEAVSESNAKGSTMGYSGATNGGYNAIPVGTLASVTYVGDAAFAFADLEKGFTQETVFLKAVYEPGEDLLEQSYLYRMVKEPYYNKFNNKPANNGGAYQVSVTFERASEEVNDVLRGVARLREPVVRQDTTTDLRWEKSDTPAVDHDLANATNTEAYSGKGKTTYTKVDVANLEEISFDMALSARQNKVDFLLEDNFGMNFVIAGARTAGNINRTGEEFTVDNYNYYVDGDPSKLPTTYYAPTLYTEREGTAGFVLYGTLNYLMEQATLYAHNEITLASMFNTVNNSLTDANLKKTGGDPYTSETDFINVANTLKQAALDAETHKGAADEADYWNAERDCAQLNYHQVQHYLLGNGLKSPTAADNDKITWCHLHDACAALNSGKPVNWTDLISKAASSSKTDIEKLTPTEIETNFHLRKDETGATGWTSSTFADAVIDAVDELINITGVAQTSITWDQVQYVINNPASGKTAADMGTHGAEKYWWYDGEDVDSFTDLLTAADAAHATPHNNTAKLPDGTTSVASRPAKLNRIETTFNGNMAASVDAPTTDWINLTENLAVKEDAGNRAHVERFANFADFKTKLTDAVHLTGTGADWYAVQYAIKNNAAPADPPTSTEQTEMDGYWWHNGGENIYDIPSMLSAANSTNAATWNNFDFNAFNALNLHLAADLKGTAIDASNFATVKAQLKAFAALYTDTSTITWEQVQYYLIHSGVNTANMNSEKSYYWWKDGGSKPTLSFAASGSTAEDKANNLAKALSDAYFRATYNGFTDAEAWGNLQLQDLQDGRLVKSEITPGSSAAFPGDFNLLTASDIANFNLKTIVGPLVGTTPSGGKPYTAATWEGIQAALINNSSVTDYWWKSKDSKGNAPEDDFSALDAAIQDLAANLSDPSKITAVEDLFTVDKLNNMGFTVDGDPVDQGTINDINAIGWDTIIGDAVSNGNMANPISWYQIQFLLSSDAWGWTCEMWNPSDSYDECDIWGTYPDSWYTGSYSLRADNLALVAPLSAEALTTNADIALTKLQGEETLRTELAGSGYTDNLIAQVELLTGQKVVLTTVLPTESPAPTASPEPSASAVPSESPAPTESAVPTESNQPTQSPEPTESAKPTEGPEPTESAKPAESPKPAESVKPTVSPTPTASAEPADSPKPTESAKPTESPEPTESAKPAESPKPTTSPKPTESPEPTESAKPAESPKPTASAAPTESPEPTGSAKPAESPEPTESPKPTESAEPSTSPEPTASPKPTESSEPAESPDIEEEDAAPVESPPAADPGGGEDAPSISKEGGSGGVPDVSLGLTFAELRERGRSTSYSDSFRAPLIMMMYGRTLA